jgi:putative transposase
MQLRYNFRLDPAPGQVNRLARAFGCARVVYNDALRTRKDARAAGLPYPKSGDLSRTLISQVKKTPERAWLGEVACWKITVGRKLSLPKIGDVTVHRSRDLPSVPSSVTVVRDACGQYFASFVIETDPAGDLARFPLGPGQQDAETGIDLGLAHFAARKQKGSNNQKKAVAKVAKAHAKVRDQRRDFEHKLSTAIVRDNQAVYVEDLCVKGLARTRLAKSVHDAGWSAFTAMLEYKCARYGRHFGKTGRFLPTSRTCSRCGQVDGPKPLNAARDVLAQGHWERLNGSGAQVRPGLVPAPRGEAATRRSVPASADTAPSDAVGVSVPLGRIRMSS